MASINSFQKIKELRERDKQAEMKTYQNSVESFEEVATKLFHLLDEKEQAEAKFQGMIGRSKVNASSFIQHQHYIERLDQTVDALQPKVQEARNHMEAAQEKLTNAHVEVKKFQMLIDAKLERKEKWLKSEENKQMDELSMQQFLNYKNR